MKNYYVSTSYKDQQGIGLESLNSETEIKVLSKYFSPIIYMDKIKVLELSKSIEVIALTEGTVYLKGFLRREKEDMLTKMNVLERDGYKCYYCDDAGKTMDHLIPMSKGGEFTKENLLTACDRCNYVKDNAVLPTDKIRRIILENKNMKRSELKKKIKQEEKHYHGTLSFEVLNLNQ